MNRPSPTPRSSNDCARRQRGVLDTCNCHLRKVSVGVGPKETTKPKEEGGPRIQHPRLTQFDITVVSEVMAVLALVRDLKDMCERLGNMVVGYSKNNVPITADNLGCGGALAVLMKDAIIPTLMQTVEQMPVLVHAGPFANIATGNSSIVADKIALKMVGSNDVQKKGFVVTEAGFSADIGMEKCFNIKCRYSGLMPNCAFIVATVRTLKMHGGGPPVKAGQPLPQEYQEENVALVSEGARSNLAQHIKNARKFNVNVIVAINQFKNDTPAEMKAIAEASMETGAYSAVVSNHWAQGGTSAADFARAVKIACLASYTNENKFQFLYPLDHPIKDKIGIICRDIYGADEGVQYSDLALKQIESYKNAGFRNLPICIAKTQYSFSCDPTRKRRPTRFSIRVREIRAYLGAVFFYPICGDIMIIPGLPRRPGFYDVDINTERQTSWLDKPGPLLLLE